MKTAFSPFINRRILAITTVLIFLLSVYFYIPTRAFIAYTFDISGNLNRSCCSEKDVLNATGEFDEAADVAIFNNLVVNYPKTSLAQASLSSGLNADVLGTQNARGENKWIEVSLSQQMLRAWEGDQIVMEFPISSGKPWTPTPKGDYQIWYKTRAQTMKGGSKELGNYYNLPNVPHNMFFHGGYAVHGAYWHNNFGQTMSHGCVNAPLTQVAALFEWTGPVLPDGQNYMRASADNPGTRVFIH